MWGNGCTRYLLTVQHRMNVKVTHRLQALVYDILSEEGAGKRCSECGSLSHVLLRENADLHSTVSSYTAVDALQRFTPR